MIPVDGEELAEEATAYLRAYRDVREPSMYELGDGAQRAYLLGFYDRQVRERDVDGGDLAY